MAIPYLGAANSLDAVNAGLFDDEESRGVQNLSDLGGARLYSDTARNVLQGISLQQPQRHR